jgi:DnaJ-class molecular chaperone
MVNWKRCKGTNQSTIGVNDWVMCESCEASGYEGNPQCSQCGGPGWVIHRR